MKVFLVGFFSFLFITGVKAQSNELFTQTVFNTSSYVKYVNHDPIIVGRGEFKWNDEAHKGQKLSEIKGKIVYDFDRSKLLSKIKLTADEKMLLANKDICSTLVFPCDYNGYSGNGSNYCKLSSPMFQSQPVYLLYYDCATYTVQGYTVLFYI